VSPWADWSWSASVPGTAKGRGVRHLGRRDRPGQRGGVARRVCFPNRRVVMGFEVPGGARPVASAPARVIHVVAERFYRPDRAGLVEMKPESADRVGPLVRSRDFH